MCTKTPSPDLTDLERENENLRDLLKFHEILNGKENSNGCVLDDFEKRMLKDLIDFKNNEFSQGSLNSTNNSYNLNDSHIEKDSFNEMFEPIRDSHI